VALFEKVGPRSPLFFIKRGEEMNSLETDLEKIVDPILHERGMELVDMEVVRQGRRLMVRFFVDRIDGGITVEECAEINCELGDVLDVEDLIEESYILEVSSPGLNRRLRKLKDFQRFIGETISVKTKERVDERKRFQGTLLTADETGISLMVEGRPVVIPHQQIARAKLKYEF
jgi:ribosome maturation factor RimP